MKFYTRQELEKNNPSRSDDFTPAKELQFRKTLHNFIKSLSKELKL